MRSGKTSLWWRNLMKVGGLSINNMGQWDNNGWRWSMEWIAPLLSFEVG
jgi:hypothetical protein